MSNSVLDPRQIWTEDLEATHAGLDGRQSQIHTAMPATIVSYDAGKMTAVVQPGIQGIRTLKDGTRKPITIAPLHDVMVCFPGGGGHILTFPVAKGDDCMLLFCERSIDNWYQHGGTQEPSDWRMHDINDVVCFVGIRSMPHVLGGGGSSRAGTQAPPASAGVTQLRSDDGTTVVQVDGPSHAVTLYTTASVGGGAGKEAIVFADGANNAVTVMAGNATAVIDGKMGNISLGCQGEIKLDCPRVVVTGQINCWSEVIAQANTNGYVSLSGHYKHSGSPSTPTPGT